MCLSVCLSLCLCLCLSVCLSLCKLSDQIRTAMLWLLKRKLAHHLSPTVEPYLHVSVIRYEQGRKLLLPGPLLAFVKLLPASDRWTDR